MELDVRSKRERCPVCDGTAMHNLVLMRPGKDVAIFAECARCSAFVARYTLRDYTCEDPYRSFLRQMRQRRMASGSLARDTAERFQTELREDYAQARAIADAAAEDRDLEDLLNDLDNPTAD